MLGGNNDFTTDMHQKDPQHENALALMQSQYAVSTDWHMHFMFAYLLFLTNWLYFMMQHLILLHLYYISTLMHMDIYAYTYLHLCILLFVVYTWWVHMDMPMRVLIHVLLILHTWGSSIGSSADKDCFCDEIVDPQICKYCILNCMVCEAWFLGSLWDKLHTHISVFPVGKATWWMKSMLIPRYRMLTKGPPYNQNVCHLVAALL